MFISTPACKNYSFLVFKKIFQWISMFLVMEILNMPEKKKNVFKIFNSLTPTPNFKILLFRSCFFFQSAWENMEIKNLKRKLISNFLYERTPKLIHTTLVNPPSCLKVKMNCLCVCVCMCKLTKKIYLNMFYTPVIYACFTFLL